ncbi:hypothetical protein GCM10009616_00530 [Microlunatus lacustris]
MSRRKAGKAGKAGKARPAARKKKATAGGPLPDAAASGTRPPAQRLYDMPYSAVAPRLVNPAVGLHNLVARAGHNAAYAIDVTLLDAPDHRLVRAGVLLAHRVLDGRGEWYLTAPDWQPLLPEDRVELMGHSDLPEELADLIRPLRRRAPLGPVAALTCDRREFALRDADGETLALLRDDRVTVRRGGLTTARYREVMITSVGRGLDEDQTAWLDRALTGVGCTAVVRFPRLVSRLGAPATGPSDIPSVAPVAPEASFKRFVGRLVGQRLRQLVEADLAVRGGDLGARTEVVATAGALAAELDGLASGVDADWLAELVEELGWLAGAVDEPERLTSRLRSERYLALLDALVAAARAPRLGGRGSVAADEELEMLLRAAVDGLASAVATAGVDGPTATWAELDRRLRQTASVAELAASVLPARSTEISRRLRRPRRRLAAVCAEPLDEAAALAAVATSDVEAVFAAGRAWERQVGESHRARQAFLTAAARATRKLGGAR